MGWFKIIIYSIILFIMWRPSFERWDGVWPGKLGLGWYQKSSSSFHWLWVSKSAFQFHHQRSVAIKYATQSQLKCKLTVIVFKAEENKRHFSKCSDLLIMNSKLPSLLFIKWSVTADEQLVLKVNGICRRASKEREYVEF